MAEPLMLVPGLDGTGLLFYRQVPLLERHWRVTAHRHRDSAVELSELVEELDAHVRQIADGRRVTLVGESFGGALSLSYALAHPDRVARLVILNSFPYFGPQARLWLGYHLMRATPWGVMRMVRQLTAWRLHSPHTGAEELRRFHALMRATTREGYLSRLRMLRSYDVRSRLPELRVPVLYLAADNDHLVPSMEQATLMASLTPRSTMRVLEGHGHICLIAPDLDLDTILEEWMRSGADGRDPLPAGGAVAAAGSLT
ncbi:MAG: alpha/beta fold hydrolase [Vicinamibacterales bacterium]